MHINTIIICICYIAVIQHIISTSTNSFLAKTQHFIPVRIMLFIINNLNTTYYTISISTIKKKNLNVFVSTQIIHFFAKGFTNLQAKKKYLFICVTQ